MTKALIIIIGIILVFLVVGFIYIKPHLWLKENREAVTVNGEPLPGAEIYHSPDGKLLFRFPVTIGYEDYIIRKESKELGLAGSEFISFFAGVYSKEVDPPVVPSSNRIKIERDLAVDFHDDFVEFTTSDTKRVKISFNR